MDETYIEGQWPLGVSVSGRRQPGAALSFYLSSRQTAKRILVLGKILNNVKNGKIHDSSTRIKSAAYGRALVLLKREGRCRLTLEHRDRLGTGTT